jgi:DNA-binding CsgD family transcriptional regulator
VATAAARSAPVLEREAELERIDAAVARARAGSGSLLVVEGPAGIGKSSLVAAARAAAAAAGLRVLAARGAELERDFAFGVARQLFEPALAEMPVAARVEVLQGPAGVAGRALGLPGAVAAAVAGDAASAPGGAFAVLHGLYWLSANLASATPLAVCVDDVHLADAPSLRFLAFLAPRLDELSVAVLLATRPQAEPATAGLHGAVVADQAASVLRPSPLSERGVAALLRDALGRDAEPAFTAACRHATGGLPFLVRELACGLRDDGVAPTAASAGTVADLGARSVGRAVARRLGRLPEAAIRLARAVAVLEVADAAQAAELAGLERDAAAAAEDALVTGGVLEARRPLAFVHPIVRAGVLEEVTGAERDRAHRRAAAILAARDGEGERVAEHLLATDPAGDPWVVERLTVAGAAALARGAPEPAARFLRRALAEPPEAAARASVLLALGVAEATTAEPTAEQRLREALHGADDDEVRVGAGLVLAHVLGRAEEMGRAVEVVDLAASLLADPDARGAVLLESIALSAGMLDAGTAPALAGRLAAMRRAADHPGAPREVLGVAALVAVHANEPARTCAGLARRALAVGPRAVPAPTDLPWFAQATVALVWADALDDAGAALDAGALESTRTGDPVLFATSLAQRAWASLRRGDLRGAEGDARAVLEAERLPAPPIYRKLAVAMLVNALVEQGDLDGAEAVAATGDVGAEPTHTSATLHLARGRLLLAARQPADALVEIGAAGAIVLATGATCPGYLAWRSAAALAHLALGEQPRARALVDEELRLARAFAGQRTLGVTLRTAGVVAGGAEAEDLLRESIDCLERAGVPLERARAMTELGAVLRRANRRREARELLVEALADARRAGAAPVAAHAEAELRATGARPRRAVLSGVASLTASERRVAQLAADGLTNREIAQALFVTARTVEGHLTRVFAKLDLRSRRELRGALAEPA